MPIWLMFIPVAAILQGIVVLFVALGQWVTGTYYALAPTDGHGGGRIEIVRDTGSAAPQRIEARLADGRVYAASFEPNARRAIVRSAPSHRDRGANAPAVMIALYAADGSSMVCHFTARDYAGRPSDGSCATADGRTFEMIAISSPPPSTARPLG
jgi:hypothetical protein